MTTIKEETPRNAPPAILPRTLSSKVIIDLVNFGNMIVYLLDI
jgi:hypothetical protein